MAEMTAIAFRIKICAPELLKLYEKVKQVKVPLNRSRSNACSPDGDMHLNANKVSMTSKENDPLPIRSPLNRYGLSFKGRPLS